MEYRFIAIDWYGAREVLCKDWYTGVKVWYNGNLQVKIMVQAALPTPLEPPQFTAERSDEWILLFYHK